MTNNIKLPLKFYQRDVLEVAKDLLGKVLCVHSYNGNFLSGKIVEVEAYRKDDDEAAHSFNGISKRNEVMFKGGGKLYVYFIYGMYHCLNVVTGYRNSGCAVLIRGIEPIDGIEIMGLNRFGSTNLSEKGKINLTNGPGKICKALNVSMNENGINLTGKDIYIIDSPRILSEQIISTTRVGIKKSSDLKWRFYIKDNPYVSKK